MSASAPVPFAARAVVTAATAPACIPARATGGRPTWPHGSSGRAYATPTRPANSTPVSHVSPAGLRFGDASGRRALARSNRHRTNQNSDAPSSHPYPAYRAAAPPVPARAARLASWMNKNPGANRNSPSRSRLRTVSGRLNWKNRATANAAEK